LIHLNKSHLFLHQNVVVDVVVVENIAPEIISGISGAIDNALRRDVSRCMVQQP